MAPPSTAYFAFEFYPCDPRCPEAEAVGQRLLSMYRAVDDRLADVFSSQMTNLNKSRVWNATDLKPYREFVQAFNGHWFTTGYLKVGYELLSKLCLQSKGHPINRAQV